MTTDKPTLILGVGNLLMGDEGIGVHAVRFLETQSLPAHVKLLDGGTGGFHLLSLFQEYDPIIIIDATMDEKAAGSVSLMHPKFASDFPKTLSAHDVGLRDLLESAQLLGALPELHLITISIHNMQPMSMNLTMEVERSLPLVAEAVRQIVTNRHAM